ncbi:MAG: alpha/beta fold hydrolase [Hominisplanchenecus sp.]
MKQIAFLKGLIHMKKEHFTYLSNDHATLIHAVRWIPEGEIRAVLQISHGMVEFVERYDAFAAYLAGQGILVTGNDHLGHGESIRTKEDYGYFAEENGNVVLIKDIHRLRRMTEEAWPNVPYFLMGHSMGSFLVRQYLCGYGRGLNGAIIMGTGYHPRAEVLAGMTLTKTMAKTKGWRYRSRLIDSLAFGGYALSQKKRRTDRDWLTKDEKIVDDYIADERCQFMFTLNAYYNMFLGLYKLTFADYLSNMPKGLPVLFTSGAQDPVGKNGKGVLKVYTDFKESGMRNVDLRLYPGDRHEILNELDREKVYSDILEWIEARIK